MLLEVVWCPEGDGQITGRECQGIERTVQSCDVLPVVLEGCYVGVARGGAVYRHGTVL